MEKLRERFRQSYAKTLLNGCPGQLRKDIDTGRVASRVMNLGTVIDQMVFGNRAYHTVSAVYKSGPRKGQPVESWTPDAKAEKDAAEERGNVAVLEKDVERMERAAGFVRSELMMRGINLASHDVRTQQKIEWVGADGILCAGTPDIIAFEADTTIDLKFGEECNPHRVRGMVWDMCWDIQGAAYLEAIGARNGTHCIARASDDCFVMVTLSPLSLSIGRERLAEARALWQRCSEANHWPWWEDATIDPPDYKLRQWQERKAKTS